MIGEILKSLRKKNHYTQAELAKKLGISQQAYGKYELNKAEPDSETLKKIATYYNVTIDFLLGNKSIEIPDEEYTILGRGGGRIKITKEQQEVINTLLDSFTKDKKE